MELINVQCDLCGADDTRPLIDLKSHDKSLNTVFHLVRCNSCGLAYINPQPTQSSLQAFYSRWFAGVNASVVNRFQQVEKGVYEQMLSVIKTTTPNGVKLLDWGCGVGGFLQFATAKGYDSLGVDYSDNAVRYINESLGLKAQWRINPSFSNETFDIVTMLDVLEHVVNPLELLSELHRVLKRGGVIIMRVPNFNFGLLQVSVTKIGIDAAAHSMQLNPPAHLYYFNPHTLSALLQKAGFRHVLVISGADMTFSQSKFRNILRLVYTTSARMLYHLSQHKLILTPAILGYAVK